MEAGMTLTVISRVMETEDVVRLTLSDATGKDLPGWEPGAHIDIACGNKGAEPLWRQFSLCGDPSDRRTYEIAVLKEAHSRGGSAYVHGCLHEGMTIPVKGPRNHFPLQPAKTHLFIAGGIGITPVLPMARRAAAGSRNWRLLYLGRTRARMALLSSVNILDQDRVKLCCSDVDGRIDLPAQLARLREGDSVYACGPERLLTELEKHHHPDSPWSLHLERFVADPAAIQRHEDDKAFEIVVASTGESYHVPPGVPALQVLREAGCNVEWSCAEGICGSCEVDVLAGEPDHRDRVLTPEERAANASMMICVSRAKCRRIVIDI